MSGGTVSRGSKAARGGEGRRVWEEEARRVYRLRMAQPGVKRKCCDYMYMSAVSRATTRQTSMNSGYVTISIR